MMKPFIIDCDTGRDDALAIWYALLKKLPLCGIVASYGNTPLENVYKNCHDVVSAFPDCAVEIVSGADKSLCDHPYYQDIVLPRQLASGNGLCDIVLPYGDDAPFVLEQSQDDIAERLVAFIKKKHSECQEKLVYVVIGPATNLSLALGFLGDEAANYIEHIVMMGGKFDGLWDALPFADFNIGADPYAVKAVMDFGLPISFVPMNATWPMQMSLAEIKSCKAQTELAEWIQKIMIAHCEKFSPEPVFRFHDPAVIVALSLLSEDYFLKGNYTLNIDDKSDSFGKLIEGDTAVSVLSLNATQHAAFRSELLTVLGLVL